jgi:hypothetical protein
MSSGILIRNAGNSVLVSDAAPVLHFRELLTNASQVYYYDTYGGCRKWAYTFACPEFPVAFFKLSSAPTSILRTLDNGNGTWTIEVIVGGNGAAVPVSVPATPPELLIFTKPASATFGTDGWGMEVFDQSSNIVFSTKGRPLAVFGASSVLPPVPVNASDIYPPPGGPEGSLQSAYCTGDYTHDGSHAATMQATLFNSTGVTVVGSDVFCSATAIHQHERERGYTGETTSGSGCSRSTTYWQSLYWACYRSAVRLSGTQIEVGWALTEYDKFWSSYTNSFNGWSQSSNSTGRGAGGKPPLSNETINYNQSAMLFIDGAKYR